MSNDLDAMLGADFDIRQQALSADVPLRATRNGYELDIPPPLTLSEDQPDEFGLPGIITGGGGLDEQIDTRPSLTQGPEDTWRDTARMDTLNFLQEQFGWDTRKARDFAETLWGTSGDLSKTAFGIGVADLLPPISAPLTMQEGIQTFGEGMETGSGTDMALGAVLTAAGALESIPVIGAGFKMLNKAAQSEVVKEFITVAGDAFNRTGEITQDALIEAGEAAQARLDSMMSGTTLSANPVGAAGDAIVAGAGKVASAMKPDASLPQFMTSDGYRFYQQKDGTLTDNPNPEMSDMTFDSLQSIADDFGEMPLPVGKNEIAERSSKAFVDDFSSFMDDTPGSLPEDVKQQRALNVQSRRASFTINNDEVPSLREVLIKKSEEMQLKPAKRVQPTDDQMFDVAPESYEQGIVPEMQIETPVPRAPAGAKLPKKGRTQGLVDNMEEIADRIAERARPHVGTNVQYFYHLGPLLKKAEDLGIPEDEAREAIKEFSLLYGATSPRTQTEPNLRSASLVRAKDKQNIRYDEIVGPGGTGINEAGFPMMINQAKKGQAAGIHKLLIDQLRTTGKIDYKTNPKPATFAENVGGNLNGVTVDTHAIRGALYMLNDIMPGSIPRQWFNSETAYKAYLDDPSNIENYAGKGIADTLDGQVVDGSKQQTEYAIFSDIYRMVADRLGVQPAEAQSLSWFANGEFTGLASPPKTIVELINERVDVTAQALGRSKDAIFKAFIEGKIPLMSFGGALVGVGMLEQTDGN